MNNSPNYCGVCRQFHQRQASCPNAMDMKSGGGSGSGAAGSAAATASGGAATATGGAAAAAASGGNKGTFALQYVCSQCRQTHQVGTVCPKTIRTDFKAKPVSHDAKVAAQRTWVFEHDESRMKAISAAAKQGNLGGLCAQWTCDWLRRRLMDETITNDTYATMLPFLADMQQWFDGRVAHLGGSGLEHPGVGNGIAPDPAPACKGLVADVAVLNNANRASYNHLSGAYYVSMWGQGADHEQVRHGVGLHFGASSWAMFDQNQGMMEVRGGVHKIVLLLQAIGRYGRNDTALKNWEMYRVQLSVRQLDDLDLRRKDALTAAAPAMARPPLTRRKTF